MKEVVPDYRAFARDLLKLCKKHGVRLSACNEGHVFLGSVPSKGIRSFSYSFFQASPDQVVLGDEDESPIVMTKKD